MGEAGGGSMRYVVAAGTRHYREGPELPLAHEDADRAADLFASMGYERVLTGVSYDPRPDAFEDALAEWCRTADLTADDVVVLYYAGHGDRSSTGQYRLACADSEQHRPRSWLSLRNLAEILADSPVRNVLFVVDACHAAAAGADIGGVTDAIVASRGRADSFGAGTWLLASARHRDLADDGAFVAELAKACERGDGPSQRYLAPDTLADRVNQRLAAAGSQQRAACTSVDHSERPPFFVNPCFDPYAEITDAGVRGDASDLSSHFEPRGRGVEHVHDPGSYFTGRERALAEARAHLSGEGGEGILVVTADPGSGKSAVLGRLVLEKCADASVNAHHQTMEALVGRLAAAADVRATTPAALCAALADRRQSSRVVVDSLDEAGAGGDKAEARRIAWELLRPLSNVPCVRLVVGSRRELLPYLGDRVPVIDLDDDAYAEDTDTAAYVAKIISDRGAPYERSPDLARRVAEQVARRAGRCFLVARMTASALLRGPTVDVTSAGWTDQLPSDVGGAFEAYFRRLSPERHDATMALLTTIAFGEGNGLPRRVWLRVAAQLSGVALGEADIDALLQEDGSYLAQARIDGTWYFRLYHQELTDHMRTRVLRHRDLRDVQECFVDTLLAFVPDRDWSRALPYVRIHLATHAAGAGALDDLIEDASFVVAAEPATLLPAVRHARRRPTLAMAVERCAYLLLDAKPGMSDRAALLAFVAKAYGQNGLADQAERISAVRSICVARREITPHRIVGHHEGDAYAVRSMNPHWLIRDLVLPGVGRAVLAAPPRASRAHVWLIDDPSQSAVLPHPADVAGLVLLPRGPELPATAVTLDTEGTLRLWDVRDQTLTGQVSGTGYTMLLDAGVLSDGTPVLVCGDSERVTVLSLLSREPLLEEPCVTRRVHRWNDGPGASACLGLDRNGRGLMLLCDGVRGRVSLHPLEGQSEVVTVLEGAVRPELADHIRGDRGTIAAICEPRNRLTLLNLASRETVSVAYDGFDHEWGHFAHDSASAPVFLAREGDTILVLRPDEAPLRTSVADKGIEQASLVAPLVRGDRVLAVAVGFYMDPTLVDCHTGDALGVRLLGHEGAVCAVRLLDALGGGDPEVLTIGNDGTARLWQLDAFHEPGEGGGCAVAVRRFDASEETETLIPWTRDPAAVMAVTDHSRVHRVAPRLPDSAAAGPRSSLLPDVTLGCPPAPEDRAEDPDGTLNLLSWQYTGHIAPPRFSSLPGWSSSVPACHCVWHRLRPDASPAHTSLTWLHGDRERVRAHLLPPTHSQPYTRLVGFDALLGRAVLLDTPEDAPQWAGMPWSLDPGDDMVCSTAFTTLAGEAVLMAGIRRTRGLESSVGGRSPRTWDPATQRLVDVAPVPAGAATGSCLWNLSTGTPYRDIGTGSELLDDVRILVPHHDRAGTRWVAQRGFDGAVSVIDLALGGSYTVCPPPRFPDRSHPFVSGALGGQASTPCWVETGAGSPLLLCLAPEVYGASSVVPVVVWDPSAPGSPRRLPVEASRILWTGPAPSGETLVALNDTHGVILCHLPSGEEVWSMPLPARVTSLAALPGSPHLDLAVGTQQGVVFLRPRLSRGWRDRLGVG
ncbi:caspase family protein [Streptomyces sp. NPDC059696]|uniref:caspase family protein n=1 Tax=Streptomyces sp. NPDC059696 TaxID=3346911 RepID=UPI0036CD31D3